MLFNEEFQRSVLKLLATNIKFAQEHAPILRDEYFESQPLRILFKLIDEHVTKYTEELSLKDLMTAVDDYVITKGYSTDIYELLKGEANRIFDTHIKTEQFVVDTIVRFARRQELKRATFKIIEILENDGSYEAAVKLVNEAVSVGAGVSEGLAFEDLKNFPKLYREEYSPKNLCSTGFRSFDDCLMGGLGKGEVHVIQAPPKSGKSTMASNIGAFNLANGKVVFHVSLEISEIMVMAKYATRITGLSYEQVLKQEDEFQKKLRKFEKLSPSLFVNHWPEATVTALEIRSWISKTKAKHGVSPDIIIIDYDDCLLPSTGFKDDLYSNASQVYSDLINLADYFACPILTFAQPQRAAWEKPNNKELIYSYDLAHSARKAHKASSVSSINFAEGQDNGILYVDLVRRGKSAVKIPIKRELHRGLIMENKDVTLVE